LFPKKNYSLNQFNPLFLGGENNSPPPQGESNFIPFSSREKTTSHLFPRAFSCPREKLKKLPRG